MIDFRPAHLMALVIKTFPLLNNYERGAPSRKSTSLQIGAIDFVV
jgi:hypothetical protein